MTEADIKKMEKEYAAFMGLDKMPLYTFESKKVSLSKAENEGFDSVAQTLYKPNTQDYKLIVADNIIIEPYILYHEFTHILDTEIYARGDKTKYVLSSGYTEYHASQIELLILLGAKSLKDKVAFSASKYIKTLAGEMTVQQYVDMKRSQAIDLFQRNDFPKNIEQLKTAIGILFNYWGLRSICYMYCKDFVEEINNTAFTQHIPANVFNPMNQLMVGWLTKRLIDLCCKGYGAMIMPLIKKYELV